MRGVPEVIAILQRAVAAEALATHQYLVDAAWLRNIGLDGLATRIAKESDEERGHLIAYTDRLELLESAPALEHASTIGFSSVREMFAHQLELEMAAVTLYTEGVNAAEELSDPVSRALLERTLADEEGHVNFIEGEMELLQRMGEGVSLLRAARLEA